MGLHLLTLPVELREMIIQQLWPTGTMARVNARGAAFLPKPQSGFRVLTGVCHQLRNESIAWIPKHVPLHITLGDESANLIIQALQRLPEEYRANVRELRINYDTDCGPPLHHFEFVLPSVECIKVVGSCREEDGVPELGLPTDNDDYVEYD